MKRTRRTFFIDMDGVLADMQSGLAELLGRPNPYAEKLRSRTLVEDASWDDAIHQQRLWDAVATAGSAFWLGLKPFSWALGLLNELRAHGDVMVCTNPGDPAFAHHAAYGKLLWCEQFLGLSSRHVILAARKERLAAGPHCVLIDDLDSNCVAWTERGGTAIVFPQPYNAAKAAVGIDPITYVTALAKMVPHA